MHDPFRQRREDRRFWEFFLFWRFIPSWTVPAKDRPILWQAYWFRVAFGLIVVVAFVATYFLLGPMAALQHRVMELAGPEAERNPGPYVLISAVLTVLGPIAVAVCIWYAIRRYLQRRRNERH